MGCRADSLSPAGPPLLRSLPLSPSPARGAAMSLSPEDGQNPTTSRQSSRRCARLGKVRSLAFALVSFSADEEAHSCTHAEVGLDLAEKDWISWVFPRV